MTTSERIASQEYASEWMCALSSAATERGSARADERAAADAEQALEVEIKLLLEAIYLRYNHDFRHYAYPSLRRRIHRALRHMNLADIPALQNCIMHSATAFTELLQYLTVPVSAMFRDPAYFLALRQQVLPVLKTYPSPKIWIAGCSTGEEVYSLAIMLLEEGLLERTVVYATDINPVALEQAARGIFRLDNVKAYIENYQRAGGRAEFADYYHAAYGNAVMNRNLRRNIVFADHSLATDSVFAETQFISCRNVLIYFRRSLQSRAVGLFHNSLCRRGFLGLGIKESIDFSGYDRNFDAIEKPLRIFRKNDEPVLDVDRRRERGFSRELMERRRI